MGICLTSVTLRGSQDLWVDFIDSDTGCGVFTKLGFSFV